MSAFLVALQFLTRLPVKLTLQWTPQLVGRSVLYYPLVGVLLGACLLVPGYFFWQLPTMLLAALILMFWVLLTGGLHLDGVADSADAWAGGLGDKVRALEIMKDSRSGALAIVVLVVLLLVKFSAIVAVLEANAWQALLIAPMVGRSSVIALLLTTPYVREQGLGSDMAKYLPPWPARFVVVLVGVSVFLLVEITQAVWLLILVVLVFALLRHLMLQRIDGMTGDTAGAMIEIIEVVCLVSLVLKGGA